LRHLRHPAANRSFAKVKQNMTCPICEKDTSTSFRPFCSKRCGDVDLGRWFNETYRVPTPQEAPGEDSAETAPIVH
jgi:uncharacterized protein